MKRYWLHTLALLVLLTGYVKHVGCRSYSIEELNSVNVTVGLPFNTFTSDDNYEAKLFELIANYITEGCALPKETCTLEAKYGRNSGAYQREITTESYNFTGSQVGELIDPSALGSSGHTTLIIYLHTKDEYDFLAWTNIVKHLYAFTDSINDDYKAALNISNIIAGVPTSYIAQVIAEDMVAPAVISGVMLGSAAIMFVVLIPLSNTKYCRKVSADEKKDIEEGKDTTKTEDKVERF